MVSHFLTKWELEKQEPATGDPTNLCPKSAGIHLDPGEQAGCSSKIDYDWKEEKSKGRPNCISREMKEKGPCKAGREGLLLETKIRTKETNGRRSNV